MQKEDITPESSGRMMCDILDNMRECYRTRNFSYLNGLIEEARYRAFRMEDALEKSGGWRSATELEKTVSETKAELKKLQIEKDRLEKEIIELRMALEQSD